MKIDGWHQCSSVFAGASSRSFVAAQFLLIQPNFVGFVAHQGDESSCGSWIENVSVQRVTIHDPSISSGFQSCLF
jgi:hypothetical protein